MMEPEGRSPFSSRLIVPVAGIGALVVIAIVVAVILSGGDDSDSASAPTPTPEASPTAVSGGGQEAAIAAYVRNELGEEYAGDCAGTTVENDAGKYCSAKRGEREGVHAYVIGLTFSEFSDWVFVGERGGQSQVVSTLGITPERQQVPGIPWPFNVGAEVVVTGTAPQNCLNVRTEPAGQSVDCITEGTAITLAAGPQEADNRDWWRVEGRDGWVAADYLRYPDSREDPVPTQPPPDNGDGTPAAEATPSE